MRKLHLVILEINKLFDIPEGIFISNLLLIKWFSSKAQNKEMNKVLSLIINHKKDT